MELVIKACPCLSFVNIRFHINISSPICLYMKLDMQKIYIDSRFKTANPKSDSDFNVELPRSVNVPDGVVAQIDDIVIPVSWTTVDERNNMSYVAFGGVGSGAREENLPSQPETMMEIFLEHLWQRDSTQQLLVILLCLCLVMHVSF